MKPQKPRFVAVKSRFLRRRRIAKGAADIEEGLLPSLFDAAPR